MPVAVALDSVSADTLVLALLPSLDCCPTAAATPPAKESAKAVTTPPLCTWSLPPPPAMPAALVSAVAFISASAVPSIVTVTSRVSLVAQAFAGTSPLARMRSSPLLAVTSRLATKPEPPSPRPISSDSMRCAPLSPAMPVAVEPAVAEASALASSFGPGFCANATPSAPAFDVASAVTDPPVFTRSLPPPASMPAECARAVELSSALEAPSMVTETPAAPAREFEIAVIVPPLNS